MIAMNQGKTVSVITKRLLFGFLIIALIGLEGGCGEQKKKPAAGLETITLAYATLPHASLVHIAIAKEFFKQEGLKLNQLQYSFGKPALEAVLQGRADLATVAETPLVFAIMSGQKIKIASVLEASNHDIAVMGRRDLGIEKPQDIKGKTIGVAKGTVTEFFLDGFLSVQGVNPAEVKIVDLPPERLMPELLAGRVAAAVVFNPILDLLQKKLQKQAVIFYREDLFIENFCIAVSPEFTEQHPETVKKFFRALLRAEEFIRDHPSEARDMVAQMLKIDPATFKSIWKNFRFKLTLNESLVITLEEQAHWALQKHLAKSQVMPNFSDYIYSDALLSLKPERVRIIR